MIHMDNLEYITSHDAPEGLATDVLPRSILNEICARWLPDSKLNTSDENIVLEHGIDINQLASQVYSELLLASELTEAKYKQFHHISHQDLWNVIFTLETLSCVSASNVMSWNLSPQGVKPGLLFTPWREGEKNTIYDDIPIETQINELSKHSYEDNIKRVNQINTFESPEKQAEKITTDILLNILKEAALDEPSNLYEETFQARLRKDIPGTRRWGGVLTMASPFESDTPTLAGSPFVKAIKYNDDAFLQAANIYLSHEQDIIELYTMMMHELIVYIYEQQDPDFYTKRNGGKQDIVNENLKEDVPRYSSFYKFIDTDLWKNYDYITRDFRLVDDSDYLLGRLPSDITGTPDVQPSLHNKRYFDLSRGEFLTGASVASPIPDLLHELRSKGLMKNLSGNGYEEYGKYVRNNYLSDNPFSLTDKKYLDLWQDGWKREGKSFKLGDTFTDDKFLLRGQLTDVNYAPALNIQDGKILRQCRIISESWKVINKHKKSMSLDIAVRTLSDLQFHLQDLKAEFAALHEVINAEVRGNLQDIYEDYRERCGYELNSRPPKQRFFAPEIIIPLKSSDYDIEFDTEKIKRAALNGLAQNPKKKIVSLISEKEAENHVRALMLSLHTLIAFAVDTIEGREQLLSWYPDIYSSIRGHSVTSVLLNSTKPTTSQEIANTLPKDIRKLDYSWKPDLIHEKYKFGPAGSDKRMTTYSEWNEFEKSIQSPNFRLFTDRTDEMSFRQLITHGISATPLGNMQSDNNNFYVLAPKILKWRLRNTVCGKTMPMKNIATDEERIAVIEFIIEFCRQYALNANISTNNMNDSETKKLFDAAEYSKEARERLMYTAGAAWNMDATAVYAKSKSRLTTHEQDNIKQIISNKLNEIKSPDLTKVQSMIETDNLRLKEYCNFVYNIVPKYRKYFDRWYISDPWMFIPELSSQEASQLFPGYCNLLDAGSRMIPLLRTLSVPKSPISGIRLYDMNMLSGELMLYMRDRRLMDYLYDPNHAFLNLSGNFKEKNINFRYLGRRYAGVGTFKFPDERIWNNTDRSLESDELKRRMQENWTVNGILFDDGYFKSELSNKTNIWFAHSFHDNPSVLPTAQEKIHTLYYGNYAGALPCTAVMLDNMLRVGIYGRYETTAALRGHINGELSPSFIAQTDRIRNWNNGDVYRLIYCDPVYEQTLEDYYIQTDNGYIGATKNSKAVYMAYSKKYSILNYSSLSARYAFLPLMHNLRRQSVRELYLDTYLYPIREKTLRSWTDKSITQQTQNYKSPFDVRCENYTEETVTHDRVKYGPKLAVRAANVVMSMQDDIIDVIDQNCISETAICRSDRMQYQVDGFNLESARMRCLVQDITYTLNKLRQNNDLDAAPIIGMYDLHPLMRVQKEAETTEEVSTTTQLLMLNAKRYYGGFVSVIQKSRCGYNSLKETLMNGTTGKRGDTYAAWQAAFLYNTTWLNDRFTQAEKIYDRKGDEFYKIHMGLPGIEYVWRAYGVDVNIRGRSYLDYPGYVDNYDKMDVNKQLYYKPKVEYDASQQKFVEINKPVYDPLTDQMEKYIGLGEYIYFSKEQIYGEWDRNMLLADKIAQGDTTDIFGNLRPEFSPANLTTSQSMMSELALPRPSRRDAPLVDILESHLYNPGSLVLKYAAKDNPPDIDFYSLYRNKNKAWWNVKPADSLRKLNNKYCSKSELFHHNITFSEFARYWNNEYDRNSYFGTEENNFKVNFGFLHFFEHQYIPLYDGIPNFDDTTPLYYPRTCFHTAANYQHSVMNAKALYNGKFLISETLSEIKPDVGDRMLYYNFRIPGVYNLTPHGCDDFSQGTPIAVVTDWETLDKKTIHAESPKEAADIAEQNYKDGINMLFPKLESVELSYENKLNNISLECLKEKYGEELAAKMDSARKCKFRHTDYMPGIEEGQILMRCLKAARNRANDVIEVEAKVIDDHRSLCDTSKPKFEDRPPAWLAADINRSAGEMIR